jgi:signal transduction histidine kinase
MSSVPHLKPARSSEGELIGLVTEALQQDRLSGLSQVLMSIARTVDAYGCILWEAWPDSVFDPTAPSGRLSVLAESFADGRICALLDLPLARSFTGSAVLKGKTQVTQDITDDPRVFLDAGDSFLKAAGIRRICSVPVQLSEGGRGALSVYRQDDALWSEDEIDCVEKIAALLPALYRTLHDKVGLSLLRRVKDTLDKVNFFGASVLNTEGMRGILGTACRLIAEAFDCLETSLYLEDARAGSGVFEMMATTWPAGPQRPRYRPGQDEGLVPWVITKDRDVVIFDLRHFERDLESIHQEYPGLTWSGQEALQAAVRKHWKLQDEDPLSPMSFIASPVRAGGSVVGALVCFVAKSGPYLFGRRELALLSLVASQLGQRWRAWLISRAIEEENQSWRNLVRSITELNHFVHEELQDPNPNERRIFNRALNVTQSVIHGAEISDVRLLDPQTRELYFAELRGEPWNRGEPEEIEERKRRRFPVDEVPPRSAGAHVFQNNIVYRVVDPEKDSHYAGTFSVARRMIVAPISLEKEVFGVLDVRSTGDLDFPFHAEAIIGLLGKQLGLYHYLATTINRLRGAEADLSANIEQLKKMQSEQSQAYEDLAHQLRSPIIQAHQRIQAFLRDDLTFPRDSRLAAVRGLCGKAKRVVLSTGLFVDLARDQPLQTKTAKLVYRDLVLMMIEAAADAKIMTDPEREIQFLVDPESFGVIRYLDVEVDHALFEQAISNLLDNAGKYSFQGTTVHISGGVSKKGRFYVLVSNHGIAVRSSQIPLLRKRSWRSEEAKQITGEGSGIGLWIVDHIMRAHGGELLITPTDTQGRTDVRLIFPAEPRR